MLSVLTKLCGFLLSHTHTLTHTDTRSLLAKLCELFGGPGGRVAKLRDYGLEKLSTQTEYGKLRQE
eukprot:3433866-Rhodomonas_salina.1